MAALILIAVGILIGKYGFNQSSALATQVPATKPISSPSITSSPTITRPATATASPTFTKLPGNNENVNFNLMITSIKDTGLLSRSITGEITNTGSIDAHNVICEIRVYSKGKQIQIGGKDSISKAIGTIGAGETATTTVDLSFGAFDGVTLSQNGATINLQIASDEKTQLLTYDFKP